MTVSDKMIEAFCKWFGHSWYKIWCGLPFTLPIWKCKRCGYVARRHTSPSAPD